MINIKLLCGKKSHEIKAEVLSIEVEDKPPLEIANQDENTNLLRIKRSCTKTNLQNEPMSKKTPNVDDQPKCSKSLINDRDSCSKKVTITQSYSNSDLEDDIQTKSQHNDNQIIPRRILTSRTIEDERNLSVETLLEKAKKNEFPKKIVIIDEIEKKFTPILHFF